MRWYFYRGCIYVKCNGSVLTLAVSCIPVWIKGFWPILDCVTHLTGAGEISLCVVTETSFTTDPLHTTLVYIYREKQRFRGDMCCLYNIIKGRAELMQSNCIIFTRQNVFFPIFSFKFCTSFTKFCSDYYEPIKVIFSPYIQDRSEKIFHKFDGEHAKVDMRLLHLCNALAYINKIWYVLYTEQNDKRNTFVFAPIFHELNSKI